MATITMSGVKPSLHIIVSGKTRCTLRSLGDAGGQATDFSPKGGRRWRHSLDTFSGSGTFLSASMAARCT